MQGKIIQLSIRIEKDVREGIDRCSKREDRGKAAWVNRNLRDAIRRSDEDAGYVPT